MWKIMLAHMPRKAADFSGSLMDSHQDLVTKTTSELPACIWIEGAVIDAPKRDIFSCVRYVPISCGLAGRVFKSISRLA